MQSAIVGVTMREGFDFRPIRSFIYIWKSMGEITEPWGTTAFVEKETTTLILGFGKKLSNHL